MSELVVGFITPEVGYAPGEGRPGGLRLAPGVSGGEAVQELVA